MKKKKKISKTEGERRISVCQVHQMTFGIDYIILQLMTYLLILALMSLKTTTFSLKTFFKNIDRTSAIHISSVDDTKVFFFSYHDVHMNYVGNTGNNAVLWHQYGSHLF